MSAVLLFPTRYIKSADSRSGRDPKAGASRPAGAPTRMRYIGIDPGTHCGYALLDESGACLASGTWDLAARRHEGGGMRFVRLERYLLDLLPEGAGARLAYEEVRRHRGVDAAHVYGGIVAVIAKVCEQAEVPYMGIPVGTVKKLATGKGNADKQAMHDAAGKRWPEQVVDFDGADALWISEALRQELSGGSS